MCVILPDRPSWILLLELTTRKLFFPCLLLSLSWCCHKLKHTGSARVSSGIVCVHLPFRCTTRWLPLQVLLSNLCCCYVQQTLVVSHWAGRWCCCGMRKASESSFWPPTSSELTGTRKHKGESARVCVCGPYPDARFSYGIDLWHNISKLGCGWAPCFHGYQRAAVRAQVSRLPSLRGTCWSTWHHTERLNSSSGSNESRSTTCLRPGSYTFAYRLLTQSWY